MTGEYHLVGESCSSGELIARQYPAGADIDHACVTGGPAGDEEPSATIHLEPHGRSAGAFADDLALAGGQARSVDVAVREGAEVGRPTQDGDAFGLESVG